MLKNEIDDLLKYLHFDSIGKLLGIRNDLHNIRVFIEWPISAEPLFSRSSMSVWIKKARNGLITK